MARCYAKEIFQAAPLKRYRAFWPLAVAAVQPSSKVAFFSYLLPDDCLREKKKCLVVVAAAAAAAAAGSPAPSQVAWVKMCAYRGGGGSSMQYSIYIGAQVLNIAWLSIPSISPHWQSPWTILRTSVYLSVCPLPSSVRGPPRSKPAADTESLSSLSCLMSRAAAASLPAQPAKNSETSQRQKKGSSINSTCSEVSRCEGSEEGKLLRMGWWPPH